MTVHFVGNFQSVTKRRKDTIEVMDHMLSESF